MRDQESSKQGGWRRFTAGNGLEQVVEHLGLTMTADQESWTGALVGPDEIRITDRGHP